MSDPKDILVHRRNAKGDGNQIVRVEAVPNGFVCFDENGDPTTLDPTNAAAALPLGVIKQVQVEAGTARTLALTDVGTLIRCTSGSAITVTVPTNASVAFPVGAVVLFEQAGAGTLSIAGAGGVTLNPGSPTSSWYKGGLMAAIKVAADEWTIGGAILI